MAKRELSGTLFAKVSAAESSDLHAIKKQWSTKLLVSHPSLRFNATSHLPASTVTEVNVVGVGIGEKIVENKPTGIRAIKFLVERKYSEAHLSPSQRLPKNIDGLPTDVEEVGRFVRFAKKRSVKKQAAASIPNPRTKIRPAQPGCSIGFRLPSARMAGTFGALTKKGGKLYILSNNHVLANEGLLPLGTNIFQPGFLDDANPGQIAQLSEFVPFHGGMNKVDCAIAVVASSSIVSKAILHIGAPAGTQKAQLDMIVHKFGRTTDYTVGRITSIDTDVKVGYDSGEFLFEEQIIIAGSGGQPFSAPGDSGSLIVERSSHMAVGLLFAGSPTRTIANHIGDVLHALAITLA